MSSSDEQQFIRQALAQVEKAQRWQRIRQVLVTALTMVVVIPLAFRPSSPELGIELTVIVSLGFIVAACTTKIKAQSNKNTLAILRAIAADRNQM